MCALARTDAVNWLSTAQRSRGSHRCSLTSSTPTSVLYSDNVVVTKGAYDAFVGLAANNVEAAKADDAVVTEVVAEPKLKAPKAEKPAKAEKAEKPKKEKAAKVEAPAEIASLRRRSRRSRPRLSRLRARRHRSRPARASRATTLRATLTPVSTTSPTASGTTPPKRSSGSRVPSTPKPLASRAPVARRPRRLTSEHPAQGLSRRADRAGRLREELRAPRRQGKYTFLVRPDGRTSPRSRSRRREAVFGVTVSSVNTMPTVRARHAGAASSAPVKRKHTKRAIVSLAQGRDTHRHFRRSGRLTART